MGPNWCLLPPELLKAIAEKVTSLADYIRFRAVCHPWRFASSPRPRHLPIQLPWLMLPYSHRTCNDDSTSTTTRLFYDLSSSKIHRLDLPETHHVEICGSSHGWLVLHTGLVTSLFNPVTRATVSLPPYTAAPPSHLGIAPFVPFRGGPFFKNWNADSAMSPILIFNVKKAILTSSPLDPGCMVFVFTNSNWVLAFCKIGDEHWTVIESERPWENVYHICDFSYCNGFLYAVHPSGSVTMYNIFDRSKMLLHCGNGQNQMCLVDGVDRDVLAISYARNYEDDEGVESELEYTVYKLSNDGEPEWIEETDVGQNVIFLGGESHAFSLSSADLQLPDWGANSLCYDSIEIEQSNQQGYWVSRSNHLLKLARLDDGTVTDISGYLGFFNRNRYWQTSLWLTPSLL